MKTLSKNSLVALGLLAAAVFVGMLIVFTPFGHAWTAASEASMRQVTLDRLSSRVGQIRQQKVLNEKLAQSADAARLYVPGGTPGTGAANLQKFLVNQVKRYGGRVNSLRVVENDGEATPNRVALSLTTTIGMNGLKKLLFKLETGMPLIVVERLSGRPAGDDDENPRAGDLSVTLQVGGLLKRGAS